MPVSKKWLRNWALFANAVAWVAIVVVIVWLVN
jgi:hypothetical protein